jgi:TRAP-type C4-dicarboxylate transport system substrate-binding protein
MATCAVAVIALMAPLAGCGATGDQAEAAGGKAGGSVPAEPVVLRMLNPAGEWESEDFVSEVEKVSNGQLRIDVVDHWHSPALAMEHDAIDAVRSGVAPLGLVAVRAWPDQGIRSFDALVAPLLVDRPALEAAVLHSDVAADMLTGLDGSGLTGIGILPGPMQHPVGVTRDLLDVADYQGASIAIPPGTVLARSLEALGATPTASFFSGAPMAAFDGFEQQLSSVGENEYDGVARSVTVNVTPRPRPLVLFVNNAAMAALSEQNREFLREAAQATIAVKTVTDHTHESEDNDILCRRGLIAFDQASPAQVDGLRHAYEPVYQWVREDTATSGFVDRIQKLSDSTPVDPAIDGPAECTAANTGAAAQQEVTPVDGTYTVNTTVDDLKAAGIPPEGWIPENWGDAVFVFNRGRFATTSHNEQACVWAYGQYILDGDTMIWDFEGGGGESPNDATNKPGEEFGFNWSLYRDVLTLTKKDGMTAPMPDGNHW